MLEPAKKNYINITIVCFLDNLNQIFQTQEVEITWYIVSSSWHWNKAILMFKLPASVFWGLYFRKVLSLFNSCAIKSHTYKVDGNFLSSDILQLLWRFWPRQDKLEHFGIIKQCTYPHSPPPAPTHYHPPTKNNALFTPTDPK